MSTEKKTKKPMPSANRDELAQVIADSLNKLNKDSDQVAYFLDGQEETPTDFTDFISTGATMLDIAVSNRPYGGIAVGRITELTGLEGSGKSLVGAQLIANSLTPLPLRLPRKKWKPILEKTDMQQIKQSLSPKRCVRLQDFLDESESH